MDTENKWLQTWKWRTAVYTIIVNNNIKNENTNDGVEGYQWLFAVTKMLNNITITHCETGLDRLDKISLNFDFVDFVIYLERTRTLKTAKQHHISSSSPGPCPTEKFSSPCMHWSKHWPNNPTKIHPSKSTTAMPPPKQSQNTPLL